MKKTAFTTVMSILLIIVCLFGLVAVGLGVKDGLAIKKYKEDDERQQMLSVSLRMLSHF